MVPQGVRRRRLSAVVTELGRFVTDARTRRSWLLRVRRDPKLFQPWNDTTIDRYPEVFAFLATALASNPSAHILSFGCSTGEEVFSLRRYLPNARIKGIDISRGNVADARRKLKSAPDSRLQFVVGATTEQIASRSLDAVLCMAVFRHGDLSNSDADSCAHRLDFAEFSRCTEDLARCLKPGGFLAIEHSNFRFADTQIAAAFDCVFSIEKEFDPTRLLFGPDNKRLAVDSYGEVVFKKR